MTTVILRNIAPVLAPDKVRLELRAEGHASVTTDIPAVEVGEFLAGLREEVGEFSLVVSEPETRASQMRRGTAFRG